MCASFEEYEEVPETVPLELLEENVMWVASKLSGAAGDLGSEVIELSNWLLCFRYVSEEFIFVVPNLADWMDNFSLHLGRLQCSDGMPPCCTI